LSAHPVLIAATDEQVAEARMRLARVGIEDVEGYLDGGLEGWKRAGFEVAQIKQMTVQELQKSLDSGEVVVLDVRRQGEWDAGHIDGADWYPLDRFKTALPEMKSSAPTAVHCKGGYRSMIAASMLKRVGHDVVNVIGGFDAWDAAKLRTVAATAVCSS
jgi:hydroxyacylglutathione hydrolase